MAVSRLMATMEIDAVERAVLVLKDEVTGQELLSCICGVVSGFR